MNEQKVSTYYETDHDRLEGLFKNFEYYKSIDTSKAKQSFLDFRNGLERHIRWEEEILFPQFEQRTGLTDKGPTHVMKMEHRIIKRHLEEIHERVTINNFDTGHEEQLLLNMLAMHNHKEENTLYPTIDRMLSDDDLQTVYKKMQSIAEQQHQE